MKANRKRASICKSSEGTPSEIGAKLLRLVKNSKDDGDTRTDRIQLINMKKLVNIFRRSPDRPLPKNLNRSIYKNLNHLKILFSFSTPFIHILSDPDPFYLQPLIDQAVEDINHRNELNERIDRYKLLRSYESSDKSFIKDCYLYKVEKIGIAEINRVCEEAISEALQGLDQNSTDKVEKIQYSFDRYNFHLESDINLINWKHLSKRNIPDHISSPDFKKLNSKEKVDDMYNYLTFQLERSRGSMLALTFEDILRNVEAGLSIARPFIGMKTEIPIVMQKDHFKERQHPELSPDFDRKIRPRIDILIHDKEGGKLVIQVRQNPLLKEHFIKMIDESSRKNFVSESLFEEGFKQLVYCLVSQGTPLGIITNVRTSILIILDKDRTKSSSHVKAVGMPFRYKIIDNVSNTVTLNWAIVFMLQKMNNHDMIDNFINSNLRADLQIPNHEITAKQLVSMEKGRLSNGDPEFPSPDPILISGEKLNEVLRTKEYDESNADIYVLTYDQFKEIFGVKLDEDLQGDSRLVLKMFAFSSYDYSEDVKDAAQKYCRQETRNLKILSNFNKTAEPIHRINCPTIYASFYVAAHNSDNLFSNVGYCVVMNKISGWWYDKENQLQKDLFNQQLLNMRRIRIFHHDLHRSNIIFNKEEGKIYIIDWAFENLSGIRIPYLAGT